jgi:hypothetical protein
MSEAELFEMFAIYTANAQAGFGLVLTIVFAYLASAYFVGQRLTTFQALVISGLFVVGVVLITSSIRDALSWGADFAAGLHVLHPERKFLLTPPLVHAVSALCLSAIPISLFFMYQIRRHPKVSASVA